MYGSIDKQGRGWFVLSLYLDTPCSTSFADAGCFRGLYVGALWGAFFHRYEIPIPKSEEPNELLRVRLLSARARIGKPAIIELS